MTIYEELLHDTTKSYDKVDYNGIEYTTCKDFSHISRYKRLRQVIHSYDYENVAIEYYQVPVEEENRLDLISYRFYNTTSYAWVIAYVNGISDSYTVYEGQTLIIPTNITDLFKNGNVLSSIPVSSLNLGTE